MSPSSEHPANDGGEHDRDRLDPFPFPSPFSHARHDEAPLEPLPADFEAELHHVDDRLADLAARASAPAGLADRIFAASVADLPDRRSAPAPTIAPARRLQLHRWRVGQVAMAAALGLAFVVAAVFLQQAGPSGPAGTTHVALNPVADEVFDYLEEDPMAERHRAVDVLLGTVSVSSAALDSELMLLGGGGAAGM